MPSRDLPERAAMVPDGISGSSRRRFLQTTGAVALGALVGSRARAHAAPQIRPIETNVISHEAQYYHGWPTLARRQNGQLLVVCSGGREAHVCPFGRVELIRSNDNGETWTWPQVLFDSAIDDRDSGVMETNRGALLITTFTSLAYESRLLAAEKKRGERNAWPEDQLRAWQLAHARLTPEQRQSELGCWMIRSTDGGVTWSGPYTTPLHSPHGPIQLSDGRLLYAGKELYTNERRIGVCESVDDGQTWRWLAEIPTRPGDNAIMYHELHAVEAANGRIIVHIRNHNRSNAQETLQAESSDGGKTWTVPHPIGVWGLPSFLLRLRSGKLLMTYGHRRAPFGNQARFSADHGLTWSEAMIISGDGAGPDLGYPSTAEIEDGTLLTVWYERPADSPRAVLRQAQWSFEV